MDNPWQVIRDLELHSSRLNKEAIILAQAKAGNAEFFTGVRLALDALITFGIKQVPVREGADGAGLPTDSFALALTGFTNRTVTGNTARDMIATMMSHATNDQWNNWYRRILIKDLRCGVSEKTINNVTKKDYAHFSVPVFTCQLAHDGANHESKVAGNKLIEVKLDGVRVLTIVYPDATVTQYSRNGKELVNFPHIKEQFAKVASQLVEPWVFDGEIMSSSFQDLMKQVHRKSDINASDAVLYLFDSLSLADFQAGKCELAQAHRSEGLKTFHQKNKEVLANVAIVGQELVDLDTPAGASRFKEINEQAIAGGYEGIMIKDPQAPYILDRDVAWLKQKPYIEVTLKATAIEEGTGKNTGRMGAVLFEGNDDGKFISVSVGGGWSDQQRAQIWADYTGKPVGWQKRVKGKITTITEQPTEKSIIGQFGEVRADAITQNQDGSYSLRFPRFKSFRGFEVGEKI